MQPDDVQAGFCKPAFDEWNERPKDALAIYEELLKKDAKLSEAYSRLLALLVKQDDKARRERGREALAEGAAR